MATSGWVLAIGGVVVGQALALGVGFVQRKWATADQRLSRVEQRGDEAAKEILVVLDEMRDLYSGLSNDQAFEVQASERYSLCHRIDR